MSDAVDKLIIDLEKNWGAKPKPGNVSPSKEESFAMAYGAKPASKIIHVAKVVPVGDGGMEYTAKPIDDADVALMDPNDSALATAIEAMGALPENEKPPWHPGCTTKENEMQVSKPVKMKVPKGCFDTTKMLTAPTVTMLKAKKLYQPVKGTSSGSRYFMIAISPALRVAARWKMSPMSEGLALRVEGAGLSNPDTVKMLEEIGLDAKSPTHMSAHLTVTNAIEARKAIGALLYAINEDWTTPRPDPEVICV